MTGRVETVIRALENAGVRYLVVGGVAVVLRGHLRTTIDLDLVLQLTPDNLERALPALLQVGLEPQLPVPLGAFSDPSKRASWSRERT